MLPLYPCTNRKSRERGQKLLDDLTEALEAAKAKAEASNSSTNIAQLKCYGIELPEPLNLSTVWNTPTELAPELISGVLREGHKMMLTGPSKAGKTFCLMQLACAVATGREWLGFECRRGKPLYINMELDEASCIARFQKIGAALKLGPQDADDILIWNLRGYSVPFADLAPIIANLVQIRKLDLVIIDPIYKLFAGSENEQEAVTAFCNNLDFIANAGASVVYCHHHSKGAQGGKSSMDRGSGSGVFARDADALLDLIQIFNAGDAPIDPEGHTVTAWQLEGILREFAPFKPKRVYFRYPLHLVDDDGILDSARPRTANQRGGTTRGHQITAKQFSNQSKFLAAVEEMEAAGLPVKLKAISEQLGVTPKTARSYANKAGFTVSNGTVTRESSTETR